MYVEIDKMAWKELYQEPNQSRTASVQVSYLCFNDDIFQGISFIADVMDEITFYYLSDSGCHHVIHIFIHIICEDSSQNIKGARGASQISRLL